MPKTQPEPIRDPAADHLLTPQNCAVVLIDYQPEQYRTITSSTRDEIDLNVIALCKLARAYDLPVIVSTVGVDMGVNTGTAAEIMEGYDPPQAKPQRGGGFHNAQQAAAPGAFQGFKR